MDLSNRFPFITSLGDKPRCPAKMKGADTTKSFLNWITCYTCVGLAAVFCYANNVGDLVHDDVRAIKNNPDALDVTPLQQVFVNDFWGKPMQGRI